MFKTMKLFILLTCCFTFTLSAKTLAQQERVSLDLKDAQVQQFFEEIQRQTNLHFLFNNEQLKDFGQVTVKAENETVTDVLDRVFRGSHLTYAFNGKMIVVRPRDEEPEEVQKSVTVKGRVTDEEKVPIPGVTVLVKEMNIGKKIFLAVSVFMTFYLLWVLTQCIVTYFLLEHSYLLRVV